MIVTTSVLGDVVEHLVGDDVAVEVLMPPGADPHDFAPSAKQAAALREADAVVRNGLGFESGLDDAIASAEEDGVLVLTATDHVETQPFGAAAAGDSAADDHGAHDHEGDDPHVFTDPSRMRAIAAALFDELDRAIPELRAGAAQARADAYLAEIEQADEEIEQILGAVPDDRRILVTNHEVFGYFAQRYGFELLGAVIPGGSTLAEPSAAALAELAGAIEAAGVPAIFVETSSSRRLAEALAAEGTDVEVVELYTESLGAPGSDAATYLDMMRVNAHRIAAALAPDGD